MKKIVICEQIKSLRKQRGISQEILAQALDISIQAVSKWETNNALPDIMLMPKIADFFGITLDELFYGSSDEKAVIPKLIGVNDDDIFRIVQFRGTKCLGAEEWDETKAIKLDLTEYENKKCSLHFDIWGNADIEGGINGGVKAGGYVNCGGVNGGVEAVGYVNCVGVNGRVRAGGSVNCSGVNGGVRAGGSVSCGGVNGGVTAGNNIHTGNVFGAVESKNGNIIVEGDIKEECKIRCKTLEVKGKIYTDNIKFNKD